MAKIPNIVSVSDLRNKYKEILERARDGPILVLAYNEVKAVVLSPDDYNELIQVVYNHDDYKKLLKENERLKQEVEQLKVR